MNETPITLDQLMQVTLWQCMPVCLNIETEPLGYEDIYNWDCYWETPIDNDHFFKFIQKYKDNLVEQCYMNHQADDYPDIFTVEVSIFTAEDLRKQNKRCCF